MSCSDKCHITKCLQRYSVQFICKSESINHYLLMTQLLDPLLPLPIHNSTATPPVFNYPAVLLLISNPHCPFFLLSQHYPTEQMDLPLCSVNQVQFPSQWTPAILKLTLHHKLLKVFNILPAFWLLLLELPQMALQTCWKFPITLYSAITIISSITVFFKPRVLKATTGNERCEGSIWSFEKFLLLLKDQNILGIFNF